MDTDSSKKNTIDINCVSAGNTLHIKIDSVNVIQNQFDKFLEKFVNNEKTCHDSQLPLFVINSFSKLFKHWLEFPGLKTLISRNVFEEVFKEMANVFEQKSEGPFNRKSPDGQLDSHSNELSVPSKLNISSPPETKSSRLSRVKLEGQSNNRQNLPSALKYFKLFCNECNDNIRMVDDNPCLSYTLHVQSEEHMKCSLKDGPNISPLNIEHTVKVASSNIGISKNTNMDCKKLNFTDSSNINYSGKLKTVNQYKLPTLDDPFCEPCCRNIKAELLSMGKHLRSRIHENNIKLYEESKKILEEYGHYFSIINKATFDFRCHICVKKQVGTTCFIQHCRGIEHRTNLEKFELSK